MHEIMIYDEIVPDFWAQNGMGISAKQVVSELNEHKGDPVTMRVNSPGGSVWEAMAIESAIHQHGNVTYQIDGVAFSAASWMGLRAANRTASQYAEIMIHEPYVMMDAMVVGNSAELRDLAGAMAKDADRLDKDADKLAKMYANAGSMSQEEYREAMREETWYDADEAMAAGLIDSIVDGGERDTVNLRATGYVNAILKRAPQRVLSRVNVANTPKPEPSPSVLKSVMDRIIGIRLDEIRETATI